jgi:PHD/YefM family antitoxin component YafN of YafNO toxin-antitoxin module
MNTIPASEVKRRGVAALEEGAQRGPLHIIKNSRPRLVVLTEEQYQALTSSETQRSTGRTLLGMMLEKPCTGQKTKEEIDAWLQAERGGWARG